MGLKASLRRLIYVYGWRVRFWWFDTQGGAIARICLAIIAAVLLITHLVLATIEVHTAIAGEPVKAFVWVYYLIVMIISAVLSYALAPKPQPPAPVEGTAPTVEDGLSVKHHFGTVWEEELFILAWSVVGRTKIRTKSGK